MARSMVGLLLPIIVTSSTFFTPGRLFIASFIASFIVSPTGSFIETSELPLLLKIVDSSENSLKIDV